MTLGPTDESKGTENIWKTIGKRKKKSKILLEGLNSEVKLCANDTCLFSIVNCVTTSASTLNSDLLKIQNWAYQWKMSFNPDRTKQAQEIIFSRKKNATTHPPLFFNNSEIKLSSNQKHLGLTLDSKLSFNEHINDKIHQANKGVGLLRKLQTILHVTVYWLFINRS